MKNNFKIKEAFTHHSENYDEINEQNKILKWMRNVIYNHVHRYLRVNDTILELNAGTGIDAEYFARKGHKIHCTDISEGMLKKLEGKIKKEKLENLISIQLLSFSELDKIEGQTFDYIFSNFGGLNCTNDLKQVIDKFKSILTKSGRITLVILPRICLWELLSVFKGHFKTSFRRFKKNGVVADIDGFKFITYYYSVSEIKKALEEDFIILDLQGLASISPPPYLERLTNSFPKIYRKLIYLDEKLSHIFPFNSWADHFIITAKLK